jgi:hypothetical protein
MCYFIAGLLKEKCSENGFGFTLNCDTIIALKDINDLAIPFFKEDFLVRVHEKVRLDKNWVALSSRSLLMVR